MSTLRIVYQLVRADFLERVRRYSFLLMLGLVVWIGYLSASGKFRIIVSPNYPGILNSAWIGATMALTVSTTLSWVGFYIVKGSVSRDYTTGVGQIMATTPLSRPLYMLGKWLSNFAVLGIAIIIVLLEGIAMNLVAGTSGFDLTALAAPLVIIALQCMGLIAAFAVLFESISWLRGALGNIIYFFVFLILLSSVALAGTVRAPGSTANYYIDFSGYQIISDSITSVAKVIYPESMGGISFGMSSLDLGEIQLRSLSLDTPEPFLWTGISWTTNILLSRLVILSVAVGFVIFAALFFDRFNPSRPLPIRKAKTRLDTPQIATAGDEIPLTNVHLTPLTDTRTSFRFGALFIAELKLFLKGQRWWWYAIAAGLAIAPFFTELELARILLLIAWIWPILILSGLGCREQRFNTPQIVFSAPRPIANQMPAAWLSAVVVLAVLGSGALIKFIVLTETVSVLGWITGVFFIPSLALALGTITGSSKVFEALYVGWVYLLYQKVTPLDFAGLTQNSPYYIYAPMALAFLAFAAFARNRQMKRKRAFG